MSKTPTKFLSKHTSFNSRSTPRLSIYLLLITSLTLLALIQIQPLNPHLHITLPSTSRLLLRRTPRSAVRIAFLPLKDLHLSKTPMDGNTWFMSSLNDTREEGETEHLFFPSDASDGRLLCLAGNSASNGTMNSYALSSPSSLPLDAELLPGLTFVSDTYYDYNNLYQGLSAVAPFVAWHGRKDCVRPARWVMYHRGEIRTRISPWVRALMEAVFGEMEVEGFEGAGGWPRCFERAVVFRHQEGSMVRKRKEELYDMMRCKSRDYCNVGKEGEEEEGIGLTL